MVACTDGRIYLDTSAIGRVLLAEPDAYAIRGVLAELTSLMCPFTLSHLDRPR